MSRQPGVSGRRYRRQSGSALLVVLVIAAVITIGLYSEVPNIVFQARRAREQQLIDNAGEYKRAIQLYVRQFHTYPPSLDALDGTNNQRFLRRHYADPLTGSSDWRILHGGPTGIVDSNINRPDPTGNGNSSTTGGGQENESGDEEPVKPLRPIPVRAPAITANNNGTGSTDQNAAPADTPLLPNGTAAALLNNSPDADSSQPDQTASQPPVLAATGTGLGPGIAGVASRASGHSIASIDGQTDYSLWEFPYDPRNDPSYLFTNAVFNNQGGFGVNGAGAPGTGTAPTISPAQTH